MLSFLALHQATETSPFSDSQPGKIMHETRKGEMAVLRELPFGRYYGGVDTTPLYIYLASAYADAHRRHGFHRSALALAFRGRRLDGRGGQANGSGFVTYQRAAESGLSNQGWKDSFDSVFHADGRIPKGPIALVEVQGYVYAAYRGLAELAARRGEAREHGALDCLGRNDAQRRSRRISGWRIAASTRSPSTATASPAGSARRMPGICFMSGCRRRSGHSASSSSCLRRHSIPAGA